MASVTLDTETIRIPSKIYGLAEIRGEDTTGNAETTDLVMANTRYIVDILKLHTDGAKDQLDTDNVVKESAKVYIDSATWGASAGNDLIDYTTFDCRTELTTLLDTTTYGSTIKGEVWMTLPRIFSFMSAKGWSKYAVLLSLGAGLGAGTYECSTIPDVYADGDYPSDLSFNCSHSFDRLHFAVV